MKGSRLNYSVNVCTSCGTQLKIVHDELGMKKCTECTEFENIGVDTIQDYNNWLKQNNAGFNKVTWGFKIYS